MIASPMGQPFREQAMSDAELRAHSVAEADLFFQAINCPKCGSGPVASAHSEEEPAGQGGATRRADVGLCASCGSELRFDFQISLSRHPDEPTLINPTDEPSRIIDLAQWITLARVFVDRSSKTADPRQARRLNLRAAECWGEALKFFDDPDNDLPPPEAFFCELSRERFRKHPGQFSRQQLLHERSKLPSSPRPGGDPSSEKTR